MTYRTNAGPPTIGTVGGASYDLTMTRTGQRLAQEDADRSAWLTARCKRMPTFKEQAAARRKR